MMAGTHTVPLDTGIASPLLAIFQDDHCTLQPFEGPGLLKGRGRGAWGAGGEQRSQRIRQDW